MPDEIVVRGGTKESIPGSKCKNADANTIAHIHISQYYTCTTQRPCGISMQPTVMPAIMSAERSSATLYFGTHCDTTYREAKGQEACTERREPC